MWGELDSVPGYPESLQAQYCVPVAVVGKMENFDFPANIVCFLDALTTYLNIDSNRTVA